MDRAALDAALMAAHSQGDANGLARLYFEAANQQEALGEIDAACFYLTQAYVFALDCGSPLAGTLNARLAKHGRDVLQEDLV